MSYAVARGAPTGDPGASPPRPTTATVYDFTCLFTHDLRRKQKRWQDGKLKYHTFNRRIMVFDDRGHPVGDAHWSGDADLMDGDEVELDRGNAIVQVGDRTGQREQDLTDVLDKRAREVEKRRQIAASKVQRRATTATSSVAGTPTTQRSGRPQHIPLSAMLQSPGPIGRAAIPENSPFEVRRQTLHSSIEPRPQVETVQAPPAKKRKAAFSPPAKQGHAQNLFGARLNFSAAPPPELLAARARALKERTNLQRQRLEQENEREKEFETTTSSPVEITLATPSKKTRETVIPRPIPQPKPRYEQSASFETDTVPQQKTPVEISDDDEEMEDSIPQPPIATAQIRKAKDKIPLLQKQRLLRQEQATNNQQLEEEVQEEAESRAVPDIVQETKLPKPAKKAPKAIKEKPKPLKQKTYSPPPQNPKITADFEAPKPPIDGPRTELRIKSNKRRRGLVMLRETYESDVVSAPTPIMTIEDASSRDRRLPSPDLHILSIKSPIIPIHETIAATQMDTPDQEEEETEFNSKPVISVTTSSPALNKNPLRSPSPEKTIMPPNSPSPSVIGSTPPVIIDDDNNTEGGGSSKEVKSPLSIPDEIDSESDVPQNRWPKRRRKQKSPEPVHDLESDLSPVSDDDDLEMEIEDVKPKKAEPSKGPRVTKLGRKGIKSREIIGFVSSQLESAAPAPFTIVSNGLGSWQGAGIGMPRVQRDIPKANLPKPNLVVSVATESVPETDTYQSLDSTEEHSGKMDSETELKLQREPVIDEPAPVADLESASLFLKDELELDSPWNSITNVEDLIELPDIIEEPSMAGQKPVNDTTLLNEEVAQKTTTNVNDTVTDHPHIPKPKSSYENGQNLSLDAGSEVGQTTTGQPMDISVDKSSIQDTELAAAPIKPRIMNPATRGKKAARKEDAAGAIPQTIVPFEPVRVLPPIIIRSVRTGPMARSKSMTLKAPTPVAETSSPAVSTLGGFSAASGGAWSRHAEDLLGMTRPQR